VTLFLQGQQRARGGVWVRKTLRQVSGAVYTCSHALRSYWGLSRFKVSPDRRYMCAARATHQSRARQSGVRCKLASKLPHLTTRLAGHASDGCQCMMNNQPEAFHVTQVSPQPESCRAHLQGTHPAGVTPRDTRLRVAPLCSTCMCGQVINMQRS
jgi:hypothetical protein